MRANPHRYGRRSRCRPFYINRAGSGLSATQRKTLEAAKGELRKLFGKNKTTRAA